MQNLPFDHLFCNFIPGEDLSGKHDTLVIEHAELSREVRCLTLWLFSETYLTQKDEQSLQAALTAQYGLRRAELHLHFPEAPFTFLPTAKQSWSRTFRKRRTFSNHASASRRRLKLRRTAP